MGRRLALFVALALSAAAAPARADVCRSSPEADTDVGSIAPTPRLAYLAWAFDREIENIDAWSWTWGSIYTAGVGAQGAAIGLTHSQATHTDLYVGVLSTAFGAVSLYGLPLKLTLPLRSARRRIEEHMAGISTEDDCTALARAERTLVSVEKDQAIAVGPLGHIGNVLVNVGIGLILGLGYGHWTSAGISFGVGLAVGETNAFTQPHKLSDVLAHYRRGQLDNAPLRRRIPPMSWSIVPLRTTETLVWGLPRVSARVTGAALQGTF